MEREKGWRDIPLPLSIASRHLTSAMHVLTVTEEDYNKRKLSIYFGHKAWICAIHGLRCACYHFAPVLLRFHEVLPNEILKRSSVNHLASTV